jgi:predicted acyl esterase
VLVVFARRAPSFPVVLIRTPYKPRSVRTQSSSAENQLKLASLGHPTHKAMIAYSAEALYDISSRSTVAFFAKTRKQNPTGRQAIVITNGQHCAFGRETQTTKIGDRDLGDARLDYTGRQIAWLDRWLKDDPAALTPKSPITVYVAGANRWVEFDAVPWAGRDPSRVFYFRVAGARIHLRAMAACSVRRQPRPASIRSRTIQPIR